MKFDVDGSFLIDCFRELVFIPSPTSYCVQLNPVLEQYAASLGHTVTYDNKDTAFITLEGEDTSKTVMLCAHADTIGMAVSKIEGDGSIRVLAIGGINMANVENETVTVHTRDGREYTGLITCQSHSTHVFADATTLPRNVDTMVVLLDERVSSREEVKALGIRHGDLISVDPHYEYTSKGFLKSRFIDDKGAIACCFTMLKYLKEHNLKPKYRTILSFSYFEEVGMGGCHVPEGVSELLSIDIGLADTSLEGNEFSVSICAKDAFTPYNYIMTNRLIEYAEKAECDYAVDTYFRYGSESNQALEAGHDIRTGLIGMAVHCSHGRERTHIDGLKNTVNLMLAYVLDI